MRHTTRTTRLVVPLVIVGALAACADTSSATSDPEPAAAAGSATDTADEAAGDGPVAEACPDTLVIQTDWYATPERAAAYQLIGPGGEVDPSTGSYRGPLGDTGVEVEVRLGGPFIGFSPVPQQMYTDTDITFGYVATDDAILGARDFPTTAVMAPLDINPQIIMFDPETYDVDGWEDVAGTDASISYVEGLPFMPYLVEAGYVTEDQVDASFDGTPARFVAEGGALMQQAYASNEPFRWENDVPEWGKPVDYLLVHDAGYEIYPQGLAVRSGELESLTPCLEAFVPLMQQAQVDYIADPSGTNQALVDIYEAISDGPPITAEGNADAVEVMAELGLVGNGPDATLGDFSLERVATTIEQLRPIFGEAVPDDLTAEDVVTNEFIDPSIGLQG